MSNFNQVVVWECTIVKDHEIQDFMNFLKEDYPDCEFQWIGSVETSYRSENGESIVDVHFYVSDETISKFATKRFNHGFRWLSDVIDNDPNRYPEKEEIGEQNVRGE